MPPRLQQGDALLIIDVQRDFCAGGAYPVPDGDAVVPVLNEWIAASREKHTPVFATRDWHPADHVSFATLGGRLPPHCVQGTRGAGFHPELDLPPDAVIISKGTQPEVDADSAFTATDLAPRLRDAHVRRLWVGGLALDDTVRATVLDALKHDFAVEVIAPATRGRVTEQPADSAGVFEQLQQAGAFVGGRHAPATPPEPAES
jgi:nicotinamidase/pyrazinamidase